MSIEIIKKQNFEVQIIRTRRRKTTCIQINNGQVIIRVPKKLSVAKIDVLIDSRIQWIKQKLLQQQQLQPIKHKQYVSGEEVYYLGRRYQLKVLIASKKTVKLSHGYLQVHINKKEPTAIRTALKKWYLEHAKQQLESKVKQFSTIMQVFPASIQVREYKARWGSCSSRGHIKFNWKLIMAAGDVVDYVVVHELCHLIEHNHSANFWQLVKTILPDYEIQRQWLRQQGHYLEL